jgi:hypothetical protein
MRYIFLTFQELGTAAIVELEYEYLYSSAGKFSELSGLIEIDLL